jgi:hypothetical protein
MPVELTVASLDRRLAELGLAAERIRENLVELEIDADRELLDRTALVGESAARWAAASARMTELWRGLALLDATLERARARRGVRRLRPAQLDQLRELLDGPSIELSSAAVPLADRVLLAGVTATERCSPAALLVRMAEAFDVSRAAVVEIGGVWATLSPPVGAARRLLADAERRAAEQGESARVDLVDAGRRLGRLAAALSRDPLAVDPEEVGELGRALEAIRLDLEATAAMAGDHVALIARARGVLAELRAVARAGEAALGALEATLDEIAALAGAGAWREARVGLDAWMVGARAMLADGRRALCAHRAPLEARNRLRGMLDAYEVKASHLGLIEDRDLAEIFARARRELYTAPTDLALVDELVRRCQATLTGPAPPSDR